ncbi:MAG TPA: TonB-dependent receptor plug domain-containing protein [Cyclobacteriaceae bacterium]|nr:TonB-dependent receptor plug domain-containing protein [Cyclobacteriaceae bacterium]
MWNHFFQAACCCLFLLITVNAHTQDIDSLMNISAFTEESELQKIINKNVTVSSQKALATRETPGIISVVTSEEIQNSGARDMIDVLRMVPGFDVLQDLQFVMGLGLRGNWANEGKVLVMMDGQPFNDLLYQTVAVGNRFSVDAIERIEIIRGPGSAIYGGSAEYGVINIITKGAGSLDGIAVYGSGGFHKDAVGRLNGGVTVAKKGDELSWDISLFGGSGIVSDRPYEDFEGNSEADLSKVTRADPTNVNMGLRYKGLSIRTMYDQYQTSDPTMDISYENYFLDTRYQFKFLKGTITPRLQYINQVPWSYDDETTEETDFKVKAERLLSQVDLNYDFSRKVNLTAGLLYFHDKGTDLLDGNIFNNTNSIQLNNYAVYAQALFKHRLFNATAGFRWEKNNRYGSAFVPRLALTKKIENFHFKVLYSQAFRAPSIQNINLPKDGVENKPERSGVFELELGYQFTPEMLLAVNAFTITTKDVLIFGSEGSGDDYNEWYSNEAKSGTNGIEVVYNVRKNGWYANLTYSFSQAIDGNTVETYMVPQTSKQYVGFAKHKVTLNTNISLGPKVTINPTFVYMGKRFAYTEVDENDESVANAIDPYLLANIFLNYRDVLPGLMIGLGAYDIFNSNPSIVQAYNGYYAPVPGRTREYIIKINYQLNFKK